MELKEYQAAAASTAQPAAYDHAYLIPGIVGEVGELFGQRAKAVWHGWTTDKLRQELVSEYGDIAWMTAILLRMEGVTNLQHARLREQALTVWGRPPSPWHPLLQKAVNLHHFHYEPETQQYIAGEAQQLWLALKEHSVAITGSGFHLVLQHNLDKLAGRVARGTLVGSGDHR